MNEENKNSQDGNRKAEILEDFESAAKRLAQENTGLAFKQIYKSDLPNYLAVVEIVEEGFSKDSNLAMMKFVARCARKYEEYDVHISGKMMDNLCIGIKEVEGQ